MTIRPFNLLLLTLCTAVLFSQPAEAKRKKKGGGGLPDVQIPSDSMTVLYGNSMIERLQENGTLESLLHTANPNKKQQFRTLAYTGDQVHYRIRTPRFGPHLAYLVKQWKADRVIMAFGMHESAQGQEGLEPFSQQLANYLSLIKQRHPDSSYILLSPIAVEKTVGDKHIDSDARNADLKLYTEAMAQQAKAHGVTFIDLYSPSAALYEKYKSPLTLDGIQLNDFGASVFGKLIAENIAGKQNIKAAHFKKPGFRALRKLVSRKAAEVAQAFHPSNGVSYYGVRARSYEYKPEIPHYLKVANILDQAIWQQAKSLNAAKPTPEIPVLKINVPGKRPRNGLGTIKSAKEDLKDFRLADGFEVNCFASSEDYPELINPLQVRFDAKGRLWVCCFASYPHPLPGATANDKILIFEDTNGDGKADKKTVFAEGLVLPDGFVFYKNGIIAQVSRKIIYLEDTNGDNKADIQTELVRGLDNTDTHHSGYLSRTPQGKLLLAEGVFHRGQLETPQGVYHAKDATIMTFDPETYQVITERQTQAPNPWKISFDRWGESIHFYGGGQIIDCDIYNVWTPTGFTAPAELGMPFRYDKGSTCEIVESAHFPKEWQGGLLTGHLLRSNEINFTPLKLVEGAKKSAGSKKILIASKNKIFRPTDICFGLDGALYISDFYYPIIGHAQHSIRDKNRDYANGRIWRVTRKRTPLLKAPTILGKSPKNLIKLLNHSHFRVRELTRVELEKHPTKDVLAAIESTRSTWSANEEHALEILWLYERLDHFDDSALLSKLLQSDNLNIQRAATRSLRFWADSLGQAAIDLATPLTIHSDDRLKIALVGVISHLQQQNPNWEPLLAKIQSTTGTPLGIAKDMASWKNKPAAAPEIPVLKLAPESKLKNWTGDSKDGVIFLRSDKAQEVVISHSNNSLMNIEVNDVPLLISSGSNLTTESQNNATLKQGLNKIRFFCNKGKVSLNLTDKLGNKPAGVTQVTKDKVAEAQAQFNQDQAQQWRAFAKNTFATTCANCHNIDGNKAVGPPLNGLLGLKQTVIYPDGKKATVTIDEDYLRNAILNPMEHYPEGYQPLMPKLQLNEKEVETMVRWLKELK